MRHLLQVYCIERTKHYIYTNQNEIKMANQYQSLAISKPHTVIIMAQGECKRFPNKHSQTIRGIPILKRTVDILKTYPCFPIVIGPDTDFFVNIGCHNITLTNPGTGLLDGIHETHDLWVLQGALILLGDVVYSRQLLDIMMNDTRQFVMYARNEPNLYTGRLHGERYGLRVGIEYSSYLYDRINWDRWRQHCNGRLQGLWHRIEPKCAWYECDDWTDDVDTPADLEALRDCCATVEDF